MTSVSSIMLLKGKVLNVNFSSNIRKDHHQLIIKWLILIFLERKIFLSTVYEDSL